MKLNSDDQKRGFQWLLGAGVFALALVGFLRWADEALTTSEREVRLEQDLLDIRKASASVSPGQPDSRISQTLRYSNIGTETAAEKDYLLENPKNAEDYHKQIKKLGKGHH